MHDSRTGQSGMHVSASRRIGGTHGMEAQDWNQ